MDAVIGNVTNVETAVKLLSTYDDAIIKLALSKTGLKEQEKAEVLSEIALTKAKKVALSLTKEQIIADAVALNADEEKVRKSVENLLANTAETKGIKACTVAEVEHALVSGGVSEEKAKEIAARYANADAATKEGASIVSAGNLAELAGGKIKAFFTSPKGFLTIGAAVIAVISAVWHIYQQRLENIRQAAEDAKETLSSLTSEVSNLESELDGVRQRMAEINALDHPTLADQAELDKLKEQNDELERELRIKTALQKQAAIDAENTAFQSLGTKQYKVTEIGEARGGQKVSLVHDVEWDEYLNDKMDEYRETQARIESAAEELDRLIASGADASAIKAAQNRVDLYKGSLQATARDLSEEYEYLKTTMADAIGDTADTEAATEWLEKWKKFLAEYDLLLNGLDFTKVKSIFDESFSKTLLPYLDSSKFGGNVDLTVRPVIDDSEMKKAGWNIGDGNYATLLSSTFSNEDGTVAILATPILPDGTVLSPSELQSYVEGILDGTHVDEKGITVGVFEGEDAIKQADEAGEKIHRAQAAWDDYVQKLQDEGYITERTAEILRLIANSVLDVGDNTVKTGEDIQTTLASITGALETAVAQYDLLKEAQEEFNGSGQLSLSTLNSIVEKFPQMAESVALYIAGLKSGNDLMRDLSAVYETDKQNYYSSLTEKLGRSEVFYNSLTSHQKDLIHDLGESYDVDLKNFATVEQKKLAIQAQIIEQLSSNYRQYVGASLEDLEAQYAIVSGELSTALSRDMSNASKGEQFFNDRIIKIKTTEAAALAKTIGEVKDAMAKFDKIVTDGLSTSWDPASYSEKASSAAASVKDAFEELKEQLEDWFGDMEFKVSLRVDAGDMEGAAKLYKEMIEQANKALDTAYASGKTVDDDWVQDLINRVSEYKKALADLRLEEYDKLIEYNDDFDVWNKVSYSKLDVLADKLKKINELYLAGYLSYKDWYDYYTDTAKEAYDIQKDALEELLETTMDAIKEQNDAQVEALENQSDAYQKLIEQKKKLLEDTKDQSDYEREVAKRVKEIAKLQEQITQLELDDSREAAAERHQLESELAEKQEELADYQAQYGTDAAIDALDEQGEAFDNSMQERIKTVKAEVESEAELRRRAIALIDSSYQQMIANVRGYFESLGVVIDDELLGKLEQGLNLVGQFGTYNGAVSNIGSTSILPQQQIPDYVAQMKQNSQSWHTANSNGDKAEMDRLAQENERIAQMLKTLFGLDIWKNAAQGKWYIRLNGQEVPLFDAYHQGGVVSGYPTRNNKEVLALLEKGEVVMDDGKQGNFLAMIKRSAQIMREQMAYTFSKAASSLPWNAPEDAGNLGGFSPTFQFTFNHNGPMTEEDAKRYGEVAADTALDKLWSTLQKRGIT